VAHAALPSFPALWKGEDSQRAAAKHKPAPAHLCMWNGVTQIWGMETIANISQAKGLWKKRLAGASLLHRD